LGSPLDGSCTLPPRPYGCGPANRICDAALTGGGKVIEGFSEELTAIFRDSCIPEGWTPSAGLTVPACTP
jgi:hypothetical protein